MTYSFKEEHSVFGALLAEGAGILLHMHLIRVFELKYLGKEIQIYSNCCKLHKFLRGCDYISGAFSCLL